MEINRRELLVGTVAAGLTGLLGSGAKEIKLVAFDAFPIFDFRPIFSNLERVFPGKGAEVANLWRTRQFEYTWLRTLSHDYRDFWRVTEDALIFAVRSLKLELTAQDLDELMGAYLRLKAWPDVPATLSHLKSSGVKLAFLSNFTEQMLETNIQSAGLEGMFDQVLSTDRVRAFKPSPQAYRMAMEAFRLSSREILFVAFGGWDAAGAKTFGYPTYWANRTNAAMEELGAKPDRAGADLSGIFEFLP